MNLYFLDANDKQHLVARNVSEEDAIPKMLIDLYNRYPDFKNYYQRTWWDNFHRYWIDYGSHTEFYILQEEKYALNVVDDAAVQDGEKELNVVDRDIFLRYPETNMFPYGSGLTRGESKRR